MKFYMGANTGQKTKEWFEVIMANFLTDLIDQVKPTNHEIFHPPYFSPNMDENLYGG